MTSPIHPPHGRIFSFIAWSTISWLLLEVQGEVRARIYTVVLHGPLRATSYGSSIPGINRQLTSSRIRYRYLPKFWARVRWNSSPVSASNRSCPSLTLRATSKSEVKSRRCPSHGYLWEDHYQKSYSKYELLSKAFYGCLELLFAFLFLGLPGFISFIFWFHRDLAI